jgi:cytoskeletal protein CcmA (bactofilin family)
MFGRKNNGHAATAVQPSSEPKPAELLAAKAAQARASGLTAAALPISSSTTMNNPDTPSTGFRADMGRRAPEPTKRESAHSKTLTVGRDIVLSGQISACEKLVVEGRVEASLTDSKSIEIAESGTFKGSVEIDEAEISGEFDGSLVVRQRLFVRATGKVKGKVRYGELEVERGGQVSGDVQVQGN